MAHTYPEYERYKNWFIEPPTHLFFYSFERNTNKFTPLKMRINNNNNRSTRRKKTMMELKLTKNDINWENRIKKKEEKNTHSYRQTHTHKHIQNNNKPDFPRIYRKGESLIIFALLHFLRCFILYIW